MPDDRATRRLAAGLLTLAGALFPLGWWMERAARTGVVPQPYVVIFAIAFVAEVVVRHHSRAASPVAVAALLALAFPPFSDVVIPSNQTAQSFFTIILLAVLLRFVRDERVTWRLAEPFVLTIVGWLIGLPYSNDWQFIHIYLAWAALPAAAASTLAWPIRRRSDPSR